MSDRMLGAVCVLLAAFFIWQATLIETGFIVDPLGPKAFPIIIGTVLGISGLYPLLRPDPEPEWPSRGGILEIGFATLVMIAFAVALPNYGFVASAAVASGLLSWRLGSSPLAAVVTGIGIAVGVYLIFHFALGINLARGPWGF
ncbi:Tripartite tricarboxylate transporter TctB family protein [Hartmannibacter diazotrophicus]|uniref:Tripartite tricarboxylate transporter TctB family protein n=1 Tax=Hartmannibacter diazotrophicus TaxID=1482074 RepID=A0A2C9D492_9HYPH|nr:tripartite tricarboxylate transporter TctB family protein [Hartmannibacter diazotrophicus]SON55106.1 Tripartite tricarboxylate transporter TctB family protein [Hartmannibacter diazotrophicus]